jgi:transposase
VNPYWLKIGGKKPLKGQDLFNPWGCVDPFSGKRELIYVDSDFRNTFNIIGICGIVRDTMPFAYKMHDGINNAAVFSDFVLKSVACGILRRRDVLVLDNAAIHHCKYLSELPGYLWSYHGVYIHFRPTWSPKLNPIELLWNTLAEQLRSTPLTENGNFSHRVVQSAMMVMNAFTHIEVEKCYHHDNYI